MTRNIVIILKKYNSWGWYATKQNIENKQTKIFWPIYNKYWPDFDVTFHN